MQATGNINNVFFESSYKHAWKKTIPEGLTEVEVDFMQSLGQLGPGSRVMDLMCGWGRHSLELATRGIEVTAIDNLKDYVEEIKTEAERKQLPVEAIMSDLLDVDLNGEYDMAICMGNSFNFFNRKDGLTILKNISAHLRPGGVFLLNSWMIAEIALKYFQEKTWHWAGEYKCVLDYQYKFFPSRIESEQTIIAPDGTVESIRGVDYIFTLDELEEMFAEAGLKTKDLFSTPKKRKFSFGDVRIYIVAEKI